MLKNAPHLLRASLRAIGAARIRLRRSAEAPLEGERRRRLGWVPYSGSAGPQWRPLEGEAPQALSGVGHTYW